MKITIGIVDDHQLFVKSLVLMLKSFKDYDIIIEASNGKDLQEKLTANPSLAPEILLLDVNMPVMNGYETCKWIRAAYPKVKVVALSMNESEDSILSMIRVGCISYLLKDTHPEQLEIALKEIATNGTFKEDAYHTNLKKMTTGSMSVLKDLSSREVEFLKFCCSELSYKEIAIEMGVSLRTVDGYREALFQKLDVHSRVGLVLEGIKRKLINV